MAVFTTLGGGDGTPMHEDPAAVWLLPPLGVIKIKGKFFNITHYANGEARICRYSHPAAGAAPTPKKKEGTPKNKGRQTIRKRGRPQTKAPSKGASAPKKTPRKTTARKPAQKPLDKTGSSSGTAGEGDENTATRFTLTTVLESFQNPRGPCI